MNLSKMNKSSNSKLCPLRWSLEKALKGFEYPIQLFLTFY